MQVTSLLLGFGMLGCLGRTEQQAKAFLHFLLHVSLVVVKDSTAMKQFDQAFRELATFQVAPAKAVQTIVKGCSAAAKLGGIYPTSSELLRELRRAIAKEHVTAQELVRLVSLDPIAYLRMISVANQALYARGDGLVDPDRIVQHLGIFRLPDQVSDFAEEKQFSRILQGRGTLGSVCSDSILALLVADRISQIIGEAKAGSLVRREMALRVAPELLLAYLYPNFYAQVALESLREPGASFERGYRKFCGEAASALVAKVAEELSLPKLLRDYSAKCDIAPWNRRTVETSAPGLNHTPAFVAYKVVKEISSFRDSHELTSAIKEFETKLHVRRQDVLEALSGLTSQHLSMVELLGIPALRIPEYIRAYDEQMVGNDGMIDSHVEIPRPSERIKPFLFELKACFQSAGKESSSVTLLHQAIYGTLLALVRALDFDRAILLMYQDGQMKSVFSYGRALPEGQESLTTEMQEVEHQPEFQAYLRHQMTTKGDPILGDDWPLVAFPVIWQSEALGVFYADRKQTKDADPLTMEEEMTLLALAELWREVPQHFT